MSKLSKSELQSSQRSQDRFASRVLQRLYYPFEYSSIPESMFVFAGLLSLLALINRLYLGDRLGASLYGCALCIHLVVAWFKRQSRLKNKKATTDALSFCRSNSFGAFDVQLFEGETILFRQTIENQKKPKYRMIAGFLMSFWGILLGGLPITLLRYVDIDASIFVLYYMFLVAATLIGTLVFGRGVRSLLYTDYAKEMILSNHRLMCPIADGVLVSHDLRQMAYLPLVIERRDGTATLALDIRPQLSIAPLSIFALLGFDRLELEKAKELAQEISKSKKSIAS